MLVYTVLFFQCTNKSAFISELKMKEVKYTENKSSHLSSTSIRDLFITVCHLKEVKKGKLCLRNSLRHH